MFAGILPHDSRNFYPRSPCGERLVKNGPRPSTRIFLSTLSLRRATTTKNRCARSNRDFYPRSPCGERRGAARGAAAGAAFLSTLSLRRATSRSIPGLISLEISIHALLAESDSAGVNSMLTLIHFYPRSPCGERLKTPCVRLSIEVFLSTLSLRRATLQ